MAKTNKQHTGSRRKRSKPGQPGGTTIGSGTPGANRRMSPNEGRKGFSGKTRTKSRSGPNPNR